MAALVATSTGRRGPELRNMWQRRSSTEQGSEARVHGTRGGTRAHLDSKARSRAAGHVADSEPNTAWRCDPKLQLIWQLVEVRPTLYLDFELVCGDTWYLGC
jgi:hypothetical protein